MTALLLASLLTAAAAPAGARAGATPPLEIRIELRTSTLWVGEPIRVEVQWKALAAARIEVERDDLCFEAVRLLVRGPRGERAYHEPPREFCEGIRAPWDMRPSEQTRTRLIFFGIGGWLSGNLASTEFEPGVIFPEPGEYKVRLAYVGGAADVFSNEVHVGVELPTPDEQPLLRQVLSDPTITYGGKPDWPQWLQRYPTARYLAWTRLAALGHRVHDHASTDPDVERRRRLDVVSQILAQDWGQFEEDALALAYDGALSARQPAHAAEIAARLRAKFPGSWTVQRLGLDQPDD